MGNTVDTNALTADADDVHEEVIPQHGQFQDDSESDEDIFVWADST